MEKPLNPPTGAEFYLIRQKSRSVVVLLFRQTILEKATKILINRSNFQGEKSSVEILEVASPRA
jgi:hypothetical protein